MLIHTVRSGETIDSIAEYYGVDRERLILNNQINEIGGLVPGQALVILFPNTVYTVQSGDTLNSIAQLYGVTLNQLYRNNPILGGRDAVYPGQSIVITYSDPPVTTKTVLGYAYTFINRDVLRKTLPYLTYLTIFTYGFTSQGNLIYIEDDELIALAREYGVAPIMEISTLTESGVFSNELAHIALNNPDVRDTLFQNVLSVLQGKNYYGLDIDFEYVYPEDRLAYAEFIEAARNFFGSYGYPVMTALAPKNSANQPGLLYESHDYAALGAASDSVLLMTYEWGYKYGPPLAVAPLNSVRRVVEYAVTEIPPQKILLGIPNYAYDWPLPFVQGQTVAETIGNVEAMQQAYRQGITISFDNTAQSPFYSYRTNGIEHIVWFQDARSMAAGLQLAEEFDLLGIGIWQIMKFYMQYWLVINSLYNIEKVI